MDLKGSPVNIEEFEQFQQADELAFQKIFEYYKPSLYAKLCRLASCPTEAEEIIQEVFIQLFLKRNEIPEPKAIFPFLYVLAKRMAISNFRKEVIRKQYKNNVDEEAVDLSSCSQFKLEQKEYEKLFNAIIDALPAQQKLVYRMNKLEERSYKEIAEHIGISKNTVRNHLSAACSFVKIKFQQILPIFILLSIL